MRSISRRLWSDSNDSVSTNELPEFTISSDENGDYDEGDDSGDESDGLRLDSDTDAEWDVTTSSIDIPREEPRARSPIMMQFGELTVRLLNPQSSSWK